jgi:PrtD family type I secretion system ABC transporter
MATCKSGFITAGIFSFFVNLLILTMPLYMFSLFDRVLNTGNMVTLFMLASMAMTALFVQALIDIGRTYLFVQVSGWIDRSIGEKVLKLSIHGALPRGNPRTTELLMRLSMLRSFVAGQQIYTIMDAPWTPVFIGILFLLNFWIGVTALCITGLLFSLALVNKLVTDPVMNRASKAATHAMATAQAAVQNADVVVSMGMVDRIRARWSVDNLEGIRLQAKASRVAGINQAIIKMLRMGSMMSVMTVAAVQIVSPEATLSRGAMMASVLLVGRALMPIEALVTGWDSIRQARESYAMVAHALRVGLGKPMETVTPDEPIGAILVENASYHPHGLSKPVLNRINFGMQPGEILGVVGPSASGKSTLARLLVGLESPSYGFVRMDGVDLSLWPSDDRGEFIGYLPQDVELLAGTVKENISRFAVDPPKEMVQQAAVMAGVHEMIQQFPLGYETQIGSSGSLLSGGQRQRIGLARAVYGNVKFVVLDEPNANLDVQGEKALTDALLSLKKKGVTVVMILHRPNILKVVDAIMVLRDGMIQRFASRDEMLPLIANAQGGELEDSKVQVLPQQKSS